MSDEQNKMNEWSNARRQITKQIEDYVRGQFPIGQEVIVVNPGTAFMAVVFAYVADSPDEVSVQLSNGQTSIRYATSLRRFCGELPPWVEKAKASGKLKEQIDRFEMSKKEQAL